MNTEESISPHLRRARMITMHEGRYINIPDIITALRDPAFVAYLAQLTHAGVKAGDNGTTILQKTIYGAIYTLTGDEERERLRVATRPNPTAPPPAQG